MSYKSIDTLQKALGDSVFAHTKDSKKAAGRALGTLIEIITFYLLKEWKMTNHISIERKLAEYGNPSITHNVEFTLHPLLKKEVFDIAFSKNLGSKTIAKAIGLKDNFVIKGKNIIDSKLTIKNSCVIAENDSHIIVSNTDSIKDKIASITTCWLMTKPYAMVECKRVGVEDGNKKGPQTIEKAKQGAYVAQTTSSLQKIRNDKGQKYGIIYKDGCPIIKPYTELLSEDQNKELKVLAQSYDWLLFLTDEGLSQFITDLLLEPSKENQAVQLAFLDSYKEGKKENIFTKSRISFAAHCALSQYFSRHISEIESWFNVISPMSGSLQSLKTILRNLANKKKEDCI